MKYFSSISCFLLVVFSFFILNGKNLYAQQSYLVQTSDGGYYQPISTSTFIPTTDGGSYTAPNQPIYYPPQPNYCYADTLSCGISWGTDSYGNSCYIDFGTCPTYYYPTPYYPPYQCYAPALSCGISYGVDTNGNSCFLDFGSCYTTPSYSIFILPPPIITAPLIPDPISSSSVSNINTNTNSSWSWSSSFSR